MKRNIIPDLCIALLILLFFYTALSKLLDYDVFIFQMKLAPLPFMKTVAPVIGYLVPLIELLLVFVLTASLFYFQLRRQALLASAGLLILFELYIVAMLLTGLRLPCTCGGIISHMSWTQHLLFNAVFISLSILGLKSGRSIDQPEIKNLFRA